MDDEIRKLIADYRKHAEDYKEMAANNEGTAQAYTFLGSAISLGIVADNLEELLARRAAEAKGEEAT
jgi:hypothetical protein